MPAGLCNNVYCTHDGLNPSQGDSADASVNIKFKERENESLNPSQGDSADASVILSLQIIAPFGLNPSQGDSADASWSSLRNAMYTEASQSLSG